MRRVIPFAKHPESRNGATFRKAFALAGMISKNDRKTGECFSARRSSGFEGTETFLSSDEQAVLWTALGLSAREAQIVVLILERHSDTEIAGQLNISMHTVHSHVERIYRKVKVHSRCELVVAVFKTYINLRSREFGQV